MAAADKICRSVLNDLKDADWGWITFDAADTLARCLMKRSEGKGRQQRKEILEESTQMLKESLVHMAQRGMPLQISAMNVSLVHCLMLRVDLAVDAGARSRMIEDAIEASKLVDNVWFRSVDPREWSSTMQHLSHALRLKAAVDPPL